MDSYTLDSKNPDNTPLINRETLIIVGFCLSVIAISLWILWALLCVRNSGWCGSCGGLGPKSRETVNVDGQPVPLVVVPTAGGSSSGSGK